MIKYHGLDDLVNTLTFILSILINMVIITEGI